MMVFTNHAEERMVQHSVTKAEVYEALNSTVSIARDGDRACKVFYGLTKSGRGIRIVLDSPQPQLVKVITVTPKERNVWPKGGGR